MTIPSAKFTKITYKTSLTEQISKKIGGLIGQA
jgi:hypothetical protein